LSSIGPLGRRLLGLFAAVLALSLLGSAIGLWALQHIGVSTDDIVQRSIANERLVADAYRLQAINAERYKAVALSSEPEVGEILGADIAKRSASTRPWSIPWPSAWRAAPMKHAWRSWAAACRPFTPHAPLWCRRVTMA